MRILIINGSPSGDDSITLQTVRYIGKFFPEHQYELLTVGQKIRGIIFYIDLEHSRIHVEERELSAYKILQRFGGTPARFIKLPRRPDSLLRDRSQFLSEFLDQKIRALKILEFFFGFIAERKYLFDRGAVFFIKPFDTGEA